MVHLYSNKNLANSDWKWKADVNGKQKKIVIDWVLPIPLNTE